VENVRLSGCTVLVVSNSTKSVDRKVVSSLKELVPDTTNERKAGITLSGTSSDTWFRSLTHSS
jgi:hypothetical protein